MKINRSANKYLSYSFLVLCAFLLNIQSLPLQAEDLQEQEFQPIEAKDEFTDTEKNFQFFMPTAASKKKTNGMSLYSLKNEYFESIKVIIETKTTEAENPSETEVYLNAYEHVKDIAIPTQAKIKVKVFNLYDQYLGYIKLNEEKPEFNIRVSPFLLMPADFDKKNKKIVSNIKEFQKAVDKPLLKEGIQNGTGLIMNKAPTPIPIVNKAPEPEITKITESIKAQNLEANPVITNPAPTNSIPVIEQNDSKPRKIKVANISDSDIKINIQKPNGEEIGSGWTIGNDVYVPQYLNFQSEPINIEPLAKLVISDAKTQKVFSKTAQELNIDERGNYVWFISGFNELDPNQNNGER